jgi:hypothetical protein
VLARLNQIDGVQSSSASLAAGPGGALVQVSVRPGADTARVAAAVRRVLRDAVKGRAPVQLQSEASAAALRQREWLDHGGLTEVAATAPGASEGQGPALLAALLLGGLLAAFGLLAWRQLGRQRASSPRPQPRLSQTRQREAL